MGTLMALLMAQSVFLTALAYLLAMVLQNTFAPLLSSFVYTIVFTFMVRPGRFSIYVSTLEGGLGRIGVICLASIVMLTIGFWVEKGLFKKRL